MREDPSFGIVFVSAPELLPADVDLLSVASLGVGREGSLMPPVKPPPPPAVPAVMARGASAAPSVVDKRGASEGVKTIWPMAPPSSSLRVDDADGGVTGLVRPVLVEDSGSDEEDVVVGSRGVRAKRARVEDDGSMDEGPSELGKDSPQKKKKKSQEKGKEKEKEKGRERKVQVKVSL